MVAYAVLVYSEANYSSDLLKVTSSLWDLVKFVAHEKLNEGALKRAFAPRLIKLVSANSGHSVSWGAVELDQVQSVLGSIDCV